LIVTIIADIDKQRSTFHHFCFSITRYRPPIADVIFPMPHGS
jgi:hypothetical protein